MSQSDLLNFDDPLKLGISLDFLAPEKQQNDKTDAVRKVYLAMKEKHETLVNELIPTLERNKTLLQVRNTAK